MDVFQPVGIVQRLQQALAGTFGLRLTSLGSLAFADVEGEGDEATTAGLRQSFGPKNGVTGIAPVQAIPTTAAQWLLYNPASNPYTAYLDEIGMLLVSGTSGAGIVLLGAKVRGTTLPATVPAASSANMGFGGRGSSNRTTQLVVASAQTLANGPGFWEPIAETVTANTSVLSVDCVNRDIRGKIMLEPGTGYALAVTSPTGTTPLFAPFGTFREYNSTQMQQ